MNPKTEQGMVRRFLPVLVLIGIAGSANSQIRTSVDSASENEPSTHLLEGSVRIPLRLASKSISESNDPLVKLVWETRETQRRRLLSTEEHTPWQIMHALLGLRQDLLIMHDGQVTSGLEWIRTGPLYQSECWFEKTDLGGRAHPFSRPYWFEGHVNQFLAMLSSCRLPLETTFRTPEGMITMKDMLRHAQMNVTSRGEVTWTLWALATYLPCDAEWVNAAGEEWSIEKLVELEVGKPVGGPTSPCGGTHGLFALAQARNVYLRSGRPLQGTWFSADQKIKRYIETARVQTNEDGSLSSSFFKGREYKPEFDKRMASQGHLLEFLLMSVSKEEFEEPWLRKAVELMCRDLMNNRQEYVSCSPLYHATNALTIYLDRVADLAASEPEPQEARQPGKAKSVSIRRDLPLLDPEGQAPLTDAEIFGGSSAVNTELLIPPAAELSPGSDPSRKPRSNGFQPPVPRDDAGFPPFPPLEDSKPRNGDQVSGSSRKAPGSAPAATPVHKYRSLDEFLEAKAELRPE